MEEKEEEEAKRITGLLSFKENTRLKKSRIRTALD